MQEVGSPKRRRAAYHSGAAVDGSESMHTQRVTRSSSATRQHPPSAPDAVSQPVPTSPHAAASHPDMPQLAERGELGLLWSFELDDDDDTDPYIPPRTAFPRAPSDSIARRTRAHADLSTVDLDQFALEFEDVLDRADQLDDDDGGGRLLPLHPSPLMEDVSELYSEDVGGGVRVIRRSCCRSRRCWERICRMTIMMRSTSHRLCWRRTRRSTATTAARRCPVRAAAVQHSSTSRCTSP